MDLIDAYKRFDPGDASDRGLKNLSRLRTRTAKNSANVYYFGEYVSQGALNVEGKCRIVSARSMLDSGLFAVQPKFGKFEGWPTPLWANEVIRLRNNFATADSEKSFASSLTVEAALSISELFGDDFRISVAAGLLGVLPQKDGDTFIRQAFRR